jgi:hypothetical protein
VRAATSCRVNGKRSTPTGKAPGSRSGIRSRTRLGRTLDAIHLAAALTFRDTSGLRVPFVTADARQREAAEPAGLPILWAD